jgi:hypothetical protein
VPSVVRITDSVFKYEESVAAERIAASTTTATATMMLRPILAVRIR